MKVDIKELKDSNEFLNTLLENIDTAVFIADENLHIHQFNDSFLNLFSGTDSGVANMSFGNAAGCINAVDENRPCGETSNCQNCVIKQSLFSTLMDEVVNEKKFLERVFYINGLPIKKYLEFTSRPIVFEDQKMILVFVYDITKIELSKLELEQKQKQIDIDLEKAGQIQKNLLPKALPCLPSIEVDWFFEPCLTVGGDIFYVRKESEKCISAYMLDVCGHGVSAALIAVTVKQFLDQLHAQGLAQGNPFSPAEILNSLEEEFPFERFDCYFTIVYLQIDLETGKTLYGCAGHVPPLVVGNNKKFEVLDQHGMIIGLGQDPPLAQYEIQLDPGDKIVLYTDGLIDYFGEKGAYQNKDHFYETVQNHADKSPGHMVKAVMQKQQELRKNIVADDDISLLVIEYKGLIV